MKPTVGFLGLGLMGAPMARRLAAAGHHVVAWNRSAVPGENIDRTGGRLEVVPQVGQVGSRTDVVISMLADLPPLIEHLDDLLSPGHQVRTLVVMSTCSPAGIRKLAATLAGQGINVVDAPVSGGVPAAEQGRLSIMVGATPNDLDRVSDVLAVLGTVTRLGDVGAGSVAKACNQLVVGATVTALAEAVQLGQACQLDRAQLLDVLGGGLASSRVLEQKRHALTTDDFTASGPARFLVKDLRFAQEAAASAGVQVPLTDLTHQLYEELEQAGLGDQDNSVVLEWLRRRSE